MNDLLRYTTFLFKASTKFSLHRVFYISSTCLFCDTSKAKDVETRT